MAHRRDAGGPEAIGDFGAELFTNDRMMKLLGLASVAFAVIMAHSIYGSEKVEPVPPDTSPTPTGENPPVKTGVPKGILDPILNEASALAKVPREQLSIVRAESVVWSDGSLGCREPGMMYTQALINGFWVVINAGGKTYDFRVDAGGRFHLCPAGRGRPPRQPNAT
jgi:hypothetical protein